MGVLKLKLEDRLNFKLRLKSQQPRRQANEFTSRFPQHTGPLWPPSRVRCSPGHSFPLGKTLGQLLSHCDSPPSLCSQPPTLRPHSKETLRALLAPSPQETKTLVTAASNFRLFLTQFLITPDPDTVCLSLADYSQSRTQTIAQGTIPLLPDKDPFFNYFVIPFT